MKCGGSEKEKKEFVFTSFFPRFTDFDVLIQCISTTTHSLLNQTVNGMFL